MGCKINPITISKLLSSLTEYFDSKYRGHLYNITEFHVEAGCNEFDNFLSSIHKVKLTTKVFTASSSSESSSNGNDVATRNTSEHHTFNFICKSTILEETDHRDNLEKYYWSILFTKEKMVYDFLDNFSRELGSELEVKPFFPKMHHCYSEGEDYSCIILDDLVSLGYAMPKTVDKGLSLQECNLIMASLARLHAFSLVVEGKQGCSLPSKYEICTTELLFSSGVEPALKQVTYNSFSGFLKLAEKFRPDLFPHLKKIDDDENIWNRLCELVKPGKSSFSCFCHGDPRLNNIFVEKSQTPHEPFPIPTNAMYSGNHDDHGFNSRSEKQVSVKIYPAPPELGLRFIDFQLTRYSSPVTDLQYALHMSTDREFREKHTDTVLETYYTEFQAVLSRFPGVMLEQSEGVGAWTLKKLKEEYRQFYMYGFLVSVILLPMILLRPGDIDKSMSQMTKAERTQFFKDGRAELVFNIGSKNHIMRERLFEMCDEMIAKNVISTSH